MHTLDGESCTSAKLNRYHYSATQAGISKEVSGCMKTIELSWRLKATRLHLAVCLISSFAFSSLAQSNNVGPIVRIRATTPATLESGHQPGVFTVYRDGGGTNRELSVYYRIEGGASNGVDYA